MANTTPLTGANAKVGVAAITGYPANPVVGAYTNLFMSKWSLDRSNPVAKFDNPRDGRLRMPTLGDAKGHVDGFYDGTNSQNPEANVAEGGPYMIKLYTDGTKSYPIQILVENLHIEPGGVEEPIAVSFDWVLQSGTVPQNPS